MILIDFDTMFQQGIFDGFGLVLIVFVWGGLLGAIIWMIRKALG